MNSDCSLGVQFDISVLLFVGKFHQTAIMFNKNNLILTLCKFLKVFLPPSEPPYSGLLTASVVYIWVSQFKIRFSFSPESGDSNLILLT